MSSREAPLAPEEYLVELARGALAIDEVYAGTDSLPAESEE